MMLICITLFTINDALAKWLVADYPVGQVLAVRSLFALIALAPLILRTGPMSIVRTARPGLHVLRVIFIAGEVACFYAAVRYMPLGNVMTIYMAAPLVVTALSVPLLGEQVGWRRWVAVLVGFAGVVLVLNPSGALPPLPALIALLGAVSFALGMIGTRTLRDSGGLTLVVWQVTATGLAGAATLPFALVPPSLLGFALMGCQGLVSLVGQLALNKSLQLSPAAVVVPFQYSAIILSMLIGWLVWGDVPTPMVAMGALLIVCSGLFVFQREQQLRRGAAAESSGEVSPG